MIDVSRDRRRDQIIQQDVADSLDPSKNQGAQSFILKNYPKVEGALQGIEIASRIHESLSGLSRDSDIEIQLFFANEEATVIRKTLITELALAGRHDLLVQLQTIAEARKSRVIERERLDLEREKFKAEKTRLAEVEARQRDESKSKVMEDQIALRIQPLEVQMATWKTHQLSLEFEGMGENPANLLALIRSAVTTKQKLTLLEWAGDELVRVIGPGREKTTAVVLNRLGLESTSVADAKHKLREMITAEQASSTEVEQVERFVEIRSMSFSDQIRNWRAENLSTGCDEWKNNLFHLIKSADSAVEKIELIDWLVATLDINQHAFMGNESALEGRYLSAIIRMIKDSCFKFGLDISDEPNLKDIKASLTDYQSQ